MNIKWKLCCNVIVQPCQKCCTHCPFRKTILNEKNSEKHPKHLQKQAFFKSVWPNGRPLRQHFEVHLQI